LQLAKPGYETLEHNLRLEPQQQRALTLKLAAEYGTVFVSSVPADAQLRVDGKAVGRATRRLRLPTRSHRLEIYQPGYLSQVLEVTPRAGVSQNLDVVLKTAEQARQAAVAEIIRTRQGQRLRLVRPAGPFRVGASRREPGRRANESVRLVQLTRPFYFGEKEVTNAEYRAFRPAHRSGSAEGASLDEPRQPVVNVGWDDAARYCNWLSEQEGLPAAYAETGGRMELIRPLTRGYRLPTEVEWAYVARVPGQGEAARYPWQGNYPPTQVVANFADARIGDALAQTVPNYDDRFRVSAPVGSFAAYPPGFYDLAGNVAEWMSDYYSVYPGQSERLVKDPAGPVRGEHHLVRGSSWRHGNITELRLSYRDYSRGGWLMRALTATGARWAGRLVWLVMVLVATPVYALEPPDGVIQPTAEPTPPQPPPQPGASDSGKDAGRAPRPAQSPATPDDRFTPSERIGADSAVAFPVDI
jgi:formylglycine-generating enzyme required for sulfatase activity